MNRSVSSKPVVTIVFLQYPLELEKLGTRFIHLHHSSTQIKLHSGRKYFRVIRIFKFLSKKILFFTLYIKLISLKGIYLKMYKKSDQKYHIILIVSKLLLHQRNLSYFTKTLLCCQKNVFKKKLTIFLYFHFSLNFSM